MKESHRKCPVLLDFRHFETFRNLRKSRTILGPIGHKKVTNLSGFFQSRFSDLPDCGGRVLCSLYPGMYCRERNRKEEPVQPGPGILPGPFLIAG